MKKIIIISDSDEIRIDIVSHLEELFPGCEIQILKYRSNSIEKGIVIGMTEFQPE